MASAGFLRLVFEGGWTDRDSYEAPRRGYRGHVWVELADGSRHTITFYDVARLSQVLSDEARAGRPFVAEPGLIVLTEVTLTNMQSAAQALADEGFFDGLPDIRE